MELPAFLNRLRSLFNIDADQLPELSPEQMAEFLVNPPRFLMRCDDATAAAIWREVEKRQRSTPFERTGEAF